MRYDKPERLASLANSTPGTDPDSSEIVIRDSLRLAGADFVSRGKVKAQAITSPGTNLLELTGTVQCGFGIVHHPTLALSRRDGQILVERHQCGCREGIKGQFCAHCAALLVSHYGHADAIILSQSSTLAEQHSTGIRIRLGTRKNTGEAVCWTPEDAKRLATANIAIIGGADTGNTQMVQSIALQLLRQKAQAGESIGLLIFDGLDDYSESRSNFAETIGARVLRLHKLPLNPFSLRGLDRKPQLHAHAAMSFSDALARAYGLGALEKSTLVQSIVAAYAARGITSDPVTWDLDAPSFCDVYEEYCSRPQSQRSDALDQVMESLSLLDLFDADAPQTRSVYDLVRGPVILDMSGYPEAVKHFALGIALEMFSSQMCSRERTLDRELQKMIFIDNADRLLSAGCPALENLLTQGREFGVGLLLSAQSLELFQDARFDYRKWIRAWMMHNAEDLQKADLEFLLQMDIHDSQLDRLYQESRHLRRLHSLIRLSSDEPVLAEDLPFYEIAGDAAQRYLAQEKAAPQAEFPVGMPLLDAENLAVVDITDDLPAAPMAELSEI